MYMYDGSTERERRERLSHNRMAVASYARAKPAAKAGMIAQPAAGSSNESPISPKLPYILVIFSFLILPSTT
jgi:hypothetical protein